MGKFLYQAKKGPGETVENILEAEHIDQAIEKIIALGYSPINVVPYIPSQEKSLSRKRKKTISFGKKVSASQIAGFTRQLFDLVDSGIPLLRALGVTLRQAQNIHLKQTIESIYGIVQDGGAFSEALARHRDIFPDLYVNMIKSGEISGNLGLILDRLSILLEKDEETRSKVRGSLIYPSLILAVGAITIFVLLTFVIPRLTEMFQDLGTNLPLPTILLISVSDFLASFWWLFVLGATVLIFLFKSYNASALGKAHIDSLKLKIPVFGPFLQRSEVARFFRTLSTLLSSGVSIVPALESVSAVLDNDVLRAEARDIVKRVSSGASLSDSMRLSHFFPEIARNMIAIGEESGRMESSLLKLAVSYEKKTEEMIKILTSLLEPLLIVGIGLIIGFVIISMLLPIFQMNFMIQ